MYYEDIKTNEFGDKFSITKNCEGGLTWVELTNGMAPGGAIPMSDSGVRDLISQLQKALKA
jgi:hypothetical protein